MLIYSKGINNCISCLYEANVDDDKIINLLNKYWNIPYIEAKERLNSIKYDMAYDCLSEYLWNQGKGQEYWQKNKIGKRLRNNPYLWKLWK